VHPPSRLVAPRRPPLIRECGPPFLAAPRRPSCRRKSAAVRGATMTTRSFFFWGGPAGLPQSQHRQQGLVARTARLPSTTCSAPDPTPGATRPPAGKKKKTILVLSGPQASVNIDCLDCPHRLRAHRARGVFRCRPPSSREEHELMDSSDLGELHSAAVDFAPVRGSSAQPNVLLLL